jgi:phage shock protein A
MGLFKRISDIVRANFYTLLDLAEDPERMLAHAIRELEACLATARRKGALAIAAEWRLERELARASTAADDWRAEARLAQWQAVRDTCLEVKAALRALEARLQEAHREQCILIAHHRAAAFRLEVQRCMSGDFFGGRPSC